MIQIEPLKKVGQLKGGELILIEKRNGIVFPATVKQIINHNTEDEEILFSVKNNYYFIMGMFLSDQSWVKNVSVVREGKATCIINNFTQHL